MKEALSPPRVAGTKSCSNEHGDDCTHSTVTLGREGAGVQQEAVGLRAKATQALEEHYRVTQIWQISYILYICKS